MTTPTPLRRVGLIGGMSFEATAVYYRLINEAVRRARTPLASADLALRSLDFAPIADLQKAGRWDEAGDILAAAARDLEAAGAECVLICANTMHLVAPAVRAATPLPLIDIIDETARALRAAGARRPLLLATRYTMEHGFYTGAMERHGLPMLTPDETGRAALQRIIFEELCAGIVADASRRALLGLIETATARGADAVVLGCTELGLILDPAALPAPGFDTTVIHARAAAAFALGAEIR